MIFELLCSTSLTRSLIGGDSRNIAFAFGLEWKQVSVETEPVVLEFSYGDYILEGKPGRGSQDVA